MDSSERRQIALETLGVKGRVSRLAPKWSKPKHSVRSSFQLKHESENKRRSYFSCRKKIRYANQHEATVNAHKAENARGVRLRVYWCENCNGYHITKQLRRAH